MSRKFDESYFRWLLFQIHEDRNVAMSYMPMLRILHDVEFVWIVANDDNRLEDGRDLRSEYTQASRHIFDDHAITVLEVLVALARRVAFNAGGEPEHWCWVLIHNLGLDKYRENLTERQANRILDIVEKLIWRNYHPNGKGGFFPLKHTTEDQRKVEIWYQMSAYINERNARAS